MRGGGIYRRMLIAEPLYLNTWENPIPHSAKILIACLKIVTSSICTVPVLIICELSYSTSESIPTAPSPIYDNTVTTSSSDRWSYLHMAKLPWAASTPRRAPSKT